MRLLRVIQCSLFGHIKWTPPNEDPETWSFLRYDDKRRQTRARLNICMRCGNAFGTVVRDLNIRQGGMHQPVTTHIPIAEPHN